MAEFNNSTDNLFAKLGNQPDGGHQKTSAHMQYPSELGNDDQHSWILFEIFDTDSLHFKTTRNNQNVDAALGAMVLGTLLQEGGGAGAVAGAIAARKALKHKEDESVPGGIARTIGRAALGAGGAVAGASLAGKARKAAERAGGWGALASKVSKHLTDED